MTISLQAGDGARVHRKLALNTTNSTLVKAGEGSVFGGFVSNLTASAKFLKFYDKVSAPTVGTDAILMTISIPANSTVPLNTYGGIRFSVGVGYGITGAIGDSDTTALAANDVVINLLYA